VARHNGSGNGNGRISSAGTSTSSIGQDHQSSGDIQVESEEDLKISKFKEAIKDAERSTLLFNLDMGKVPLMSKETMNRKATLALAAMAAKKEKKNTSIPSEDAVAAIDDCLRATTGMDFFGATTKTYKHPTDPNNGAYCTVPVRYQFKDRDDKARAEKILRDLCDVHCATPYPIMVRDCMKQIIAKVKGEFPDNLIKVTVDCSSMRFKIARKERGNGKDVMPWIPYKQTIPIPDEALDVMVRKVPEDFKVTWPQSPTKKTHGSTSNTDVEPMTTDASNTPAP
jgi:hypothetical protein